MVLVRCVGWAGLVSKFRGCAREARLVSGPPRGEGGEGCEREGRDMGLLAWLVGLVIGQDGGTAVSCAFGRAKRGRGGAGKGQGRAGHAVRCAALRAGVGVHAEAGR